MFKKSVAVICTALALSSPAMAQDLSGEQIRQQIVGQTIEGRRMGVTMRITLQSNGSAALQSTIANDTGSWVIRANQLCMTWSSFRGGQERCAGFSPERDGFRMEDGPLMRIVSGG